MAAAREEPRDHKLVTSASTVARLVTGLTSADQEDVIAEEVAQKIEEAVHQASEEVADIKAEEEAEADQVKADRKNSEKEDASSAARKVISRETAQMHVEEDLL